MVQLEKFAVKSDGNSLEYIKNKTKELCSIAFDNTAAAILHIPNPTSGQLRQAVKRSPKIIHELKKPGFFSTSQCKNDYSVLQDIAADTDPFTVLRFNDPKVDHMKKTITDGSKKIRRFIRTFKRQVR